MTTTFDRDRKAAQRSESIHRRAIRRDIERLGGRFA